MKTTRHSFFPSLTLFLTFLTLLFATAAKAQVPSYVPTSGLVGWWPFNGNANDESGNGNNGTVNGPALTADRFGALNSAYYFSGSTIDIPHNPSLGIQQFQGFTVSIWALKESSISLTHLIGKRPQGAQNYNWQIADSDGLQFTATAAPDVFGAISTQPTNTQVWDHIVGIYENGLWELYVNSQLVASAQSSFFQADIDTPLAIGNSGGWGGFLGNLDDLAIWNRALSNDELLALYNGCSVAQQVVTGSASPSSFANSTYTCVNNVGSTYTWSVNNGVIANGQGTNSVSILWGAEGVGSVSVVETTADGCVGDVVTFDVVIIPNSIEELSNQLILYPNPATTELNLQITSDLIGTDVFVFDALGKQILKQQVLSTNTRINTSAFSAGNYVVKVGGGVTRFEVKK
jgi:hypothetical protein